MFTGIIILARTADGVGCGDLFPGQVCCAAAEIDPKTQQPALCTPSHTVSRPCFARDGVLCDGAIHHSWRDVADVPSGHGSAVWCDGLWYASDSTVSNITEPCAYNNPESLYSFYTTLGLSVFLGWLGVDRFYLGYPAMGIAKMFTCGFLFVGQVRTAAMLHARAISRATEAPKL